MFRTCYDYGIVYKSSDLVTYLLQHNQLQAKLLGAVQITLLTHVACNEISA